MKLAMIRNNSQTSLSYTFLKIVFIVFLFQIFGIKAIYSQVNTEAMRAEDHKNGFHHQLSLSYDMNSGNTNIIDLKSKYRTDWVGEGFKTFVIYDVKNGRQEGETYVNKGFIHWRVIMPYDNPFFLEYFIQKEYNDFIAIKDRSLVGAYLRTSLHDVVANLKAFNARSYFGTGFMFETTAYDERVDMQESKLVRWTNYFSLMWQPREYMACGFTNYYQVNVSNWSDFRFLAEGSIRFIIEAQLSFKTTASLRYHSLPPTGIKKYDIEITNGIEFNF
jgi:putative salt-induced outer membrane protein YdiY